MNEWLTDRLPAGVRFSYGLVIVETDRASAVFDRLAAPSRFWNGWHTLGVLMTAVLSALTFLFLGLGAVAMAGAEQQPEQSPDAANAVLLPGVNDAIPWVVVPAVVLALAVTVLVHESGHGIACRVAGVDVDEAGIAFLGPVPLGAFVRPAEGALEAAPLRDRLRVLSAGVMNNVALGVLVTPLLIYGLAHSPGEILDAYRIAVQTDGAAVGAIGALGFTTNAVAWTWALNVNLALMNALPVWPLDGGRCLYASIGDAGEWLPVSVGGAGARVFVGVTSVLTLVALAVPFVLPQL